MMNKLLILLLSVFIVSFVFAETYHVSEFGDDETGDGSEGNPWATIQKAADAANAGDVIMVDFGTYNETVIPKNNGSEGSPIVYMSKEQGQAEITFGDTLMLPAFEPYSDAIYVMNDVFRTIDHFSEDGTPLLIKDHIDSLAAGSIFHDRAGAKLYVWSSDGADPSTHADTVIFIKASFDIIEGSYITIDGFTIKGFYGIRADVADNTIPLPGLVIQNNIFAGSGLATEDVPETFDEAIRIYGGGANAANTYEGVMINNNDFQDYKRAILFKNCGRNGVVSANNFIGIGIPPAENDETIRVEGDDDFPEALQAENMLFDRNYFKVYGRCFYFRRGKIDNIKLQNNIANAPGSLFIINYNGTNVHIINNSIIGTGDQYAVRFNQGADNGRFYNNIFSWSDGWNLFFDNRGDSLTGNSALWDYNYWVTDTAITSRRDDYLVRARNPAVGDGTGGEHAVYGHPMVPGVDTLFSAMTGDTVFVDHIPDMLQPALPLFAGTLDTTDWENNTLYVVEGAEGFQLAEGSLAIDAGWAEVAPEWDFRGYMRDSKPDIGAFEYGASSAIAYLNEKYPREFTLNQNYPNPFNPQTTVKYQLPKAGKVTMYVYNVLGQRIATLYNGFQKMGTHTETWNGKNEDGDKVPTGVYFLRLDAGSVSKSIKMVLLK
jgi:hypothetical protein